LKRWVSLILALLLLLPGFSRGEDLSFLPLSVGSKGNGVTQLKNRLYELGYFKTANFNKKYTEDTAKVVREFQEANGLPATGETDAETWARLFSDQAVRKPHPTLPPLATPAPTPVPDWPERDAEGFLAREGEYFYENDEEGLWIYLGQNLKVVITRRVDSSIPLEWFETEIWTRNGEAFRTVVTDPDHPGRKLQYPFVIAREAKAVLAFSDDFYANRIQQKETVGIIVREGRLISSKTNKKAGHHLPNLDMMAQFRTGRCRSISATNTPRRSCWPWGPGTCSASAPSCSGTGRSTSWSIRIIKASSPGMPWA